MVISFVLLDSGQYGMMGENSPCSEQHRLYWIILPILAFLTLAHMEYGVTASRVPEKTRILGNGSSKSVSRRYHFAYFSSRHRVTSSYPTKASAFPEKRQILSGVRAVADKANEKLLAKIDYPHRNVE